MEICRVCGQSGGIARMTKTFAGLVSTWVECTGCGVYRISPYPSRADLVRYYGNGYLRKQSPGEVSHALRFSASYRPTVFEEYRLSLADLGIQSEALLSCTVLDWGCADGVFLDFLQSAGLSRAQMFGVDISAELVAMAVAKGYRAYCVTEVDDLPWGTVDLVTFWDVIEHIENPSTTVAELSRRLRPRARVLVQTPRIGFISEAYGELFEHFLPLEHLHLFPRPTLIDLFARHGFRTVQCASFGANAPPAAVPAAYKRVFDKLAKTTDHGATQLALFERDMEDAR